MQPCLEIHFRFDGHDLAGVGGIENVQLGKPFAFPMSCARTSGQRLEPPCREATRALKRAFFTVGGNLLQGIDVG